MDYPDAERDLDRLLPLVKWFLAIPHYIVLVVLLVAAVVAVVIAWFAILFTGDIPALSSTSWSESAGGACESRRTPSC